MTRPESSLLAAARASSGNLAPASIRAISSRRPSPSSGRTLVRTSVPLASACFSMNRCVSARAATCGAWVTVSTCTFSRQPLEPPPNRVGDGTTDAGVDFVEDQHRRRTAVREHHLQGEEEPAELAARRHLHHRPRERARIGLHMERHEVEAARRDTRLIHLLVDDEFRRPELEVRQLRLDRLAQQPSRPSRARRSAFRADLRYASRSYAASASSFASVASPLCRAAISARYLRQHLA